MKKKITLDIILWPIITYGYTFEPFHHFIILLTVISQVLSLQFVVNSREFLIVVYIFNHY